MHDQLRPIHSQLNVPNQPFIEFKMANIDEESVLVFEQEDHVQSSTIDDLTLVKSEESQEYEVEFSSVEYDLDELQDVEIKLKSPNYNKHVKRRRVFVRIPSLARN